MSSCGSYGKILILNVISKDIFIGFWYFSASSELWNDLKDHFGESNGPMLYKIHKEICSITQGSMSIIMYYTALKKLWDKYRILEPIPVCTYGAGRQIVDHSTRNRLIQFLMGLHDCYDSIRDQILLLEHVPSVAKAYSMVLRMEKQKDNHVQFGDNVEHNANLVRSGYSASSSTHSQKQAKEGDKFCTYCKETNRMKENCFKLIGYLEW